MLTAIILFNFLISKIISSYDFTKFEDSFLDHYLKTYSLPTEINYQGNYSFFPSFVDRKINLYGATDIIFTLFITNNMDRLTTKDREDWSEVINSFQDDTGFYKCEWYEEITGYQPYHASSYAVGALKLLGKEPRIEPKWAISFANCSNETYWEEVFNELLKPKKGEHLTIWQTSHRIVSYSAVLYMIGESFPKFETWFWDWLSRKANPETGYWSNNTDWNPPSHVAMGGSFHMYYNIMKKPWNYVDKVFSSTVSLQSKNGLFDPGKHITYCIDLDGVFTITRSAKMMEKKEYIDKSRDVCNLYLGEASKILNEEVRFIPYEAYSHLLPGGLAAIAECQTQFPDLVKTKKKWKQVVDYVPYV